MNVYVIIENGDPYSHVYQTFESAVAVVKARHKETIEEQVREVGYDICSDLDTPEDTVTGKTYLYVEKGIHIYIYKLPLSKCYREVPKLGTPLSPLER